MGCGTSNEFNYYDTPFEEETTLRQFEIEDLVCFKKVFSSIINQFGITQGLIDKTRTEEIFLKEYSENVLKVLQHFKKEKNGKEYYDSEKIKNFVYLTCPDCIFKVNEKNTHDKIGYFLYQIKTNLSDGLVTPIPKANLELDKFIGNLFDIACIDIPNTFKDMKGLELRFTQKIADVRNDFIKEYINYFFTLGGSVKETFSYEEIEKKFTENPMILTSGDIRLQAMKLVK